MSVTATERRVGAAAALGQPGLREPVDEPHGARVGEPERAGAARRSARRRGSPRARTAPPARTARAAEAATAASMRPVDRQRERAEQVGVARHSYEPLIHCTLTGRWIRAPRPSTTSARSSPARRKGPPPRTCPSCGAEHATLRAICPSCDKRYDRRFARVSDTPALGLGGLALVGVIVAGDPDPPRRVRRQARHRRPRRAASTPPASRPRRSA